MKRFLKTAGVAITGAALFWIGYRPQEPGGPVASLRRRPAPRGGVAKRSTTAALPASSLPPSEPEATEPTDAQAQDPEIVPQRLDARSVILKTRQALGCLRVSRLPNGMLLKGSANCNGGVSAWTVLFNGTGSYLQDFQGSSRRSTGSDGKSHWEVASAARRGQEEAPDLTLPERVLGLFNGQDLTVAASLQERRSDDGCLMLTLPARAHSGMAQVAVSEESWLPLRMEWNTPAGMERWEFLDYVPVARIHLPHLIVRETRWGTVQYQVQEGGGAPDLGPNPYRAQVPRIAQLRPGNPATGAAFSGREADDLGEPGLHAHSMPG